MTIQTHSTANRKALANAISERLLGAPVVYDGVPTCAYLVGASVTIDRQGNIEVRDDAVLTILKPLFIERGWLDADADEPEVDEPEVEVDEPEAEAEAPEAGAIPNPEHGAGVDAYNIAIPAPLTVAQLTNLVRLLYSKQRLLNRSVLDGKLVIPEALIAHLEENTPESPEAFSELLNDFKAIEELEGFSYEGGIVRMDFPFSAEQPERWMAFADLAGRIIHAAREATRVKAEIQDSENEKYYMRAWLLRLGYGGAELKDARTLLLKNLKGHSAFPNAAAAEKHKEKYAAIRRDARAANGGQTEGRGAR